MLFANIDPNVGWYISAFFVPLCAAFILLWLYNRRENRRRRAMTLATELGSWGLSRLAHIFMCYAIGDYSGFIESIHALHERMRADGLPDVFQDLFEKLLAHFAKDENWRDEIRKVVEAAEVATGATASAKDGK